MVVRSLMTKLRGRRCDRVGLEPVIFARSLRTVKKLG
jgi:hypothetical protein